MPSFDPVARLREGDASAWPRLAPEFLPPEEVSAQWTEALQRRAQGRGPRMLRVYTHFPYCKSTCDFCMYFHRVPKRSEEYTDYVDYLVGRMRPIERSTGRIDANCAYFGGGTPTALPAEQLGRYLEAFSRTFRIAGEFTVETHPGTLDFEKLTLLTEAGVNRLSMGIQSFDEDVLRTITRRNRPLDYLASLVQHARADGMAVNMDLVLGLPGQTLQSFQDDVETLCTVGPDSVSLYRYQPVFSLPAEPPPRMRYRQALTPELLERLERRSYTVGDPIEDDAPIVRLLRDGGARAQRWADEHQYAQFDETPSQLFGFGPGAYSHVFGYAWYREATPLDALTQRPPVYFGTRLSRLEEVRQLVVAAVTQRERIDLDELARESEVDVEASLRDELRFALTSGVASARGSELSFGGDASDEQRNVVAERLVPAREVRVPTADEAPAAFERELVQIRGSKHDPAPDPELVRAWCRALEVPSRGGRVFNAVVRGRDERSVYFSVGGPKNRPLRVLVQRRDQGRSFYQAGPYAIAYSTQTGRSLTAEEKQFLRRLAAAMKHAATANAVSDVTRPR